MGNEQTVVLDASAVLAVSYGEKDAEWVVREMGAAAHLLISTVTVTEVLISLLNRLPEAANALEDRLKEAGVEIVPVDMAQAIEAGTARGLYPLNLGDCFVYALAKKRGATILTLDKDFKNSDVPVLLPSSS